MVSSRDICIGCYGAGTGNAGSGAEALDYPLELIIRYQTALARTDLLHFIQYCTLLVIRYVQAEFLALHINTDQTTLLAESDLANVALALDFALAAGARLWRR